jgi:hypothetical protein
VEQISFRFLGRSFGAPSTSDSFSIAFAQAGRPSVPCIPTARNATFLTCAVADNSFILSSNRDSNKIYANFTLDQQQFNNVFVGTVTPTPRVDANINQAIATNADELAIAGLYFSYGVDVYLSVGACVPTVLNDTLLSCSLVLTPNIAAESILSARVVPQGSNPDLFQLQPVARFVDRTRSKW